MELPIIVDNETRWLELKRGKFSASQINRLMTEPKDKSQLMSEGARTYIDEVAAEHLTDRQKDAVLNNAMQRGKDEEPQAFAALCENMGWDLNDLNIQQYGVQVYGIYKMGLYCCASPDGINLNDNSIIEIKCPDSATHLKYLRLLDAHDVLKKKAVYYDQMQLNILLSGADKAWFVSYDSRYLDDKLKLKIIEVPKDEERISMLLTKIEKATVELLQIINQPLINKS